MTPQTLAKQLADAKTAHNRAMSDGDPGVIHLTDRAVREIEQTIRDDQNLTWVFTRSVFP